MVLTLQKKSMLESKINESSFSLTALHVVYVVLCCFFRGEGETYF